MRSVIWTAGRGAVCLAAAIAAELPALEAQAPADPQSLYRQACAACHGDDARGLPEGHPLLATMGAPPPDFTDPMFTSREPAADWELVIKYGGAPLGLSEQMPAFGDFLHDNQIRGLVEYLKGRADTRGYPPGEMNLIRPIETIKAYPEDEFILIGRYRRTDDGLANGLKSTIYYATRIGSRGHAEFKLTHTAEGDRSQVDEVEIGLKLAAAHNPETQTLWTVGLDSEVPVLERDRPAVISPFLSVAQILSDSFTLQAVARSDQSTDGISDSSFRTSGIVHWLPSPWPRALFPGFEAKLVVPYDGDRETEFSVIPQLLVGLNRGGSVSAAFGVELPLKGLSEEKFRLHWFLLWDLADGAFWKGW